MLPRELIAHTLNFTEPRTTVAVCNTDAWTRSFCDESFYTRKLERDFPGLALSTSGYATASALYRDLAHDVPVVERLCREYQVTLEEEDDILEEVYSGNIVSMIGPDDCTTLPYVVGFRRVSRDWTHTGYKPFTGELVFYGSVGFLGSSFLHYRRYYEYDDIYLLALSAAPLNASYKEVEGSRVHWYPELHEDRFLNDEWGYYSYLDRGYQMAVPFAELDLATHAVYRIGDDREWLSFWRYVDEGLIVLHADVQRVLESGPITSTED